MAETAPNRRRTARAGTVYEVKPNDERARATGARGVDRSLMFAGRRPRQSAGPRRGAQTTVHHPRTPARTVNQSSHGSTYSARLHRHETTHCDDTLVTRVSMEDGHNEVRNSITNRSDDGRCTAKPAITSTSTSSEQGDRLVHARITHCRAASPVIMPTDLIKPPSGIPSG